jgi:glycosyltransferase involved in cell wall biosynthesis
MRIAMISEHASPLAALGGVDAGGQNRHVAELAAVLGRHGHAVTVYTRRDDAAMPVRVRADGYDVVHVPAGPPRPLPKDELLPYMEPFGTWLADRWRGAQPDVIHAHFWMSGVAAVRASSRRIPVVLTYHALGSVKRRYQADSDTSPPERVDIETFLGRSVARVVAQCRDEAHELVRMGVPTDRIEIIPSGVDTDRFRPDGGRARRAAGRARILAAGRLVPRKGFDDLIRALGLLPEAELVVLGDADSPSTKPEARRLLDLADQVGVADRVRLPGAAAPAQMPQWYRSADVVACTPWYEPFGLTPLEAMACGVPVVTYAVGGLQESVVDGLTGLQVPPGDVSALAAALHRVCAEPALRERLGRAAVHRARAYYTWDRTASLLGQTYTSAALHPATREEVSS